MQAPEHCGLITADNVLIIALSPSAGNLTLPRLSWLWQGLWYHSRQPAAGAPERDCTGGKLMAERIVLYGSDICPMVPPVRNLLDRVRADYDYISISRNRAARERVMEINAGNASVPTLVFPDSSTLTEPTLAELTSKLEEMGFTVGRETFWDVVLLTLQSPRLLSFGAIFLVMGLTLNTPSLTFAGSVLLASAALGRLALLRRR